MRNHRVHRIDLDSICDLLQKTIDLMRQAGLEKIIMEHALTLSQSHSVRLTKQKAVVVEDICKIAVLMSAVEHAYATLWSAHEVQEALKLINLHDAVEFSSDSLYVQALQRIISTHQDCMEMARLDSPDYIGQ